MAYSLKTLYYRVNGPYLNDEGRQIVIVQLFNKKKKTMSYARYLMENKLERYLTEDEEVDHIDDNFMNDSIENLQILTGAENRKKTNKTKWISVICKYCKIEFQLELRRYKRNQITLRKQGPYCSKSCAGKAHH